MTSYNTKTLQNMFPYKMDGLAVLQAFINGYSSFHPMSIWAPKIPSKNGGERAGSLKDGRRRPIG